VDDDEVIVGYVRKKFADVQVHVALGAPLGGVERDAPRVVGPGLASFGDGGAPVGGTLFGRHLEKLLRAIAVKARQRQPAVKFVWVHIAEEKVSRIDGLLLGFLAESALAGFEGFGDGDVAET